MNETNQSNTSQLLPNSMVEKWSLGFENIEMWMKR